MTSTLIIYKHCRIREEKLFIVDDLSSYLNTLEKETITAFQYQRQGMSLRIKLNKSQTTLDFTSVNDFNYASIQNDSEKVCYYFIKNKKQLADSTIELELTMDTINTFRPTTDFEISSRTKVNREHKNRVNIVSKKILLTIDHTGTEVGTIDDEDHVSIYNDRDPDPMFTGVVERNNPNQISIYIDNPTSVQDYIDMIEPYIGTIMEINKDGANYILFTPTSMDDFTFNATNTYNRIIDINSEGLTPLLYGKNKGILQGDNQSWYLIYKGNNPLNCYLCADNGFTAELQSSDKEIVATDLVVGTYYYILPERNMVSSIIPYTKVELETAEGKDVSAIIKPYSENPSSPIEKYVTYYYRDGTDIKVGRFYYHDIGLGFYYVATLTLYTTSKIIIKSSLSPIKGNILGTLTHNTATIKTGASFDINILTASYDIYDINTLNRTDADIAKIIKLPYRPADEYFTGWRYDSTMHMLLLSNLSSTLETALITAFNPLEELRLTAESPSLTANKNKKWESKLFHSDYYQPKFVYDSFSFIFALERQNGYVPTSQFIITFTATGTINSRFLFTFASYNVEGYILEDYSNILPIARNNELPIYNSDYINYIKMGFNYDVKSKQRQEAGQWIGTALSLAGSIASFASSSVTGGFGIAGGISLATATLGQLVNAVNSTAQAEANQAQKLFQLRQQKESVMGSDDLDIMSKYTGNKAKWMLYQVSLRMESVLFDLFYFTGYIDGTNKIPNVTTRKWFNFLSCDLVINEDNNINDDIINDIKAKYALGVTFMHRNTINSVKTWDWQQEKENWETSLFE